MKQTEIDKLFAPLDDPDYWDEDEYDRRDYLGVMISYSDLKKLALVLNKRQMQRLVDRLDRWGEEIDNVL